MVLRYSVGYAANSQVVETHRKKERQIVRSMRGSPTALARVHELFDNESVRGSDTQPDIRSQKKMSVPMYRYAAS